MKKLFFCAVLLLVGLHISAKENQVPAKPRVDNRVELMSIVFRLAGRAEYSSNELKQYVGKIEDHFGKYRNHELILYVKSVMNERGLGYDAVMSMAVNLDKNLFLRKDLAINSLDKRWGEECADKFTLLLRKFYVDADCEGFFKSNADFYKEVAKRFLPVYEQIDLNWYKSFYGNVSSEKFTIINAPANGQGNYGVSVNYKDGNKEASAIMGAWGTDSTGMPLFRIDDYFPTLLHEFNHSFINHINAKHSDLLKDCGEQLFSLVENEMRSQAYGNWLTMMNEALVRACVIKYMKDHDYADAAIQKETKSQIDRGFFWIGELVGELDKYSSQRDIYPSLESYVPRLAGEYKRYVAMGLEMENRRPKVASITEFSNGDKNVRPSIKTITINFDKPLSGKAYSIVYGQLGPAAFPKVLKIEYAPGNMSVVMSVELLPEKAYQFVLTGKGFKSPEGLAIKSYMVNFETGK
ncbi:MAG: hypothetical protein A2X18_11615 [Bacteroidetes bacterium GWF2_40_14]|nr:MAG: hypothetical protein A2X18_11615 [Bacteroidetes bacterium GWF2_40_14]